MAKPGSRYTLHLAKDEFDVAQAGVAELRKQVLEKWKAAPVGDEKDFYRARLDYFDALLSKFEAVRVSDTSQDAETEEDEDSEPDGVQNYNHQRKL